MNNTDKAAMDAARRMLRGRIDVEEVSVMLDIPVEKLMPIKEELDSEMRKVFGNMSAQDQNGDEVLFDLFDDKGENYDMMQSTDED
jgi:hypothetical protein